MNIFSLIKWGYRQKLFFEELNKITKDSFQSNSDIIEDSEENLPFVKFGIKSRFPHFSLSVLRYPEIR
jgi:hypothetical protein